MWLFNFGFSLYNCGFGKRINYYFQSMLTTLMLMVDLYSLFNQSWWATNSDVFLGGGVNLIGGRNAHLRLSAESCERLPHPLQTNHIFRGKIKWNSSTLTRVINQHSSRGKSLHPPREEDNISTSSNLRVCNLANADVPLPSSCLADRAAALHLPASLGDEKSHIFSSTSPNPAAVSPRSQPV